ncbi:MAG: hypothetical protein NZT92_21460 [Abditibacteriales bacterium]|nr:hypothetical protein [Abditibacteriales bacterium]MDW8368272.1 hypothetical protein [Abditibacteriales bacterium]
MSWIDVVVILIFIGVLFLEMVRGFFPALLWFIIEYVVMLIADHAYAGLSKSFQFFQGTTNDGFWHGFIFITLSGLGLWLSHYLATLADIDLGGFEQAVGMIIGFGTAIIIAHSFVHMLDIGSGNGPVHQTIVRSSIANEMLNFPTWNKWIGRLLQWSRTAEY